MAANVQKALAVFAVLCVAAVAGCTGVSRTDAGAACLEEAGQPLGKYVYGTRNGELALIPGNGGTEEEAARLNACMQERIARSRPMTVETQYPDGSQRVEVRRAGDRTVKTYTYGTPPSSSARPMTAMRSTATTDYRARFDAETTTPRTAGTAICPAGAPVIYGGARYCRN